MLGYRRQAVDEAIALREAALEDGARELAGARARAEDLERVSRRLAERVVERERALRDLRSELAAERERGGETMRMLAALGEELDAVRTQARGQATRIRLRALRDAVELSERIGELSQGPGRIRERLLESLQEAIARMGAQDEAGELAERAAGNGHAHREAGEVFEGMVQVEIGPLHDFSQLVGFEDAARSIAATSEISVERFSGGRATLAVSLSEPVELLRELEERCDLEFRVRDLRRDRLVLDIGDE